ncbi:MAG: hypothetical protein MK116_09830 [Phycisphaerales bacterium]|nr:hypothetical protein [Phycisphaerales bacterium]
MRGVIPLLLVAMMCSGCLTRPPAIGVDSVEITARNEQAMAVQFNMVLSNGNNRPIEPLEFTYNVSVAGRGVYKGRHAAEMTLDAGGQDRPLALPAVIPYDRVSWSEQTIPASVSWSLSGTLVYMDEGVFAETLLDLGYRPSTGFRASGELQTTVGGSEPAGSDQVSSSAQSSSPTDAAGS